MSLTRITKKSLQSLLLVSNPRILSRWLATESKRRVDIPPPPPSKYEPVFSFIRFALSGTGLALGVYVYTLPPSEGPHWLDEARLSAAQYSQQQSSKQAATDGNGK